MSWRLFDEDESREIWARPDPRGVTLRTRYKGTQETLDGIKERKIPKHTRVNTQGAAWHPACSIPMELYEQFTVALGRQPTPEELIAVSQTPEFRLLALTDKRLSVDPEARAFANNAESLLRGPK
jgi:hypothetical protein